jgi:hypothetical protein
MAGDTGASSAQGRRDKPAESCSTRPQQLLTLHPPQHRRHAHELAGEPVAQCHQRRGGEEAGRAEGAEPVGANDDGCTVGAYTVGPHVVERESECGGSR